MKKYLIIIAIFIVTLTAILFWGLSSYLNSIKPVSKNTELKKFYVENGQNYYTIAHDLKKANLIKSELGYKIYLKLNPPKKALEAGEYKLSESMGVKKILAKFAKGSEPQEYSTVRFDEGKNMRNYANNIFTNFGFSPEDFYALLSDQTYLDELINKYWFLTDDIKNPNIYYSLEGYLYPNTYQFNDDITLKGIIEKLLDEEERKLEPYKEKILNSNFSIHEIITLASVVEIESRPKDRKGVAGVFMNRLNSGMSLGSDVTTYYGVKLDLHERDLYIEEINSNNPYNTRNTSMAGKLPIGPICNPTISSIEAVLDPEDHDYFFFVSDKKNEIHFTKTYQEHNAMIQYLKNNDLWYEY